MKGIKLLQSDIQRGVTLLKDKNYNSYCNGITKNSVQFFEELVKKGIIKIENVKNAILKYDSKHWYSLTLKTNEGLQFSFYGCSFGYGGEGSRGSKYILDICKFKNTDSVFNHRNHDSKIDILKFKK